MRKKLAFYAKKADLMNISLEYQGEKYRFNLYQESVIDEETINKELMEQPTSYGFLCMLQVKLKKSLELAELKRKEKYSELFLEFREEKDENTGRTYAKDIVENLVMNNEEYIVLEKKSIQAKHNLGTIEQCIKVFEQRGNLIQTLSANKRKEQ